MSETTKGQAEFELKYEHSVEDESVEASKPEIEETAQIEKQAYDLDRQPLDERPAETVEAGGVPGEPAEDERLEPAAETVEAGGVPGKEISEADGADEAGGVPGKPVLESNYDTQDFEVAAIDSQPVEDLDNGGAVEAGGVPGHEISKQAGLELDDELRQAGEILDIGPQQLDELSKLEQTAAGSVPGVGIDASQSLDVFDTPLDSIADFNPLGAGGVPGHGLGAADITGLLGSEGAGKGFDLTGKSGQGTDTRTDLGSLGLGADSRQGWTGSQATNDNIGTPPGFGSGSGSGSTGSSDSTGVPTGGGHPGKDFADGGGGDVANSGGGTYTIVSDFNDYTDSRGNVHIENTITSYNHETGETMVDHTVHTNTEGTTQNITVYDKDDNVVEQETTHDPPASSDGDGSSSGDDNSGSESDTSGEAPPSNEGGEDGYTPADDYGQIGGAIDFKLGEPAVDGLTVPVEPGAGDARWGSERLLQFGDGINDPRTVYPTGDDSGSGGTSGGGTGGTLPGEGVVDPIGPGFFTEGFASEFASNADDEYMEPTSFEDRDEIEF